MFNVIFVIAALAFVYLGVRLVMKLREMTRWKDEDAVVGAKGKSAVPPELRELKIEEPSEDAINRVDAPEEKRTSGDETLPKRT